MSDSLGAGFFILLYYLPIYFQSVQNVTASQSGIRNLPLILAMSKLFILHDAESGLIDVLALFIVISGGTLGAVGYFAPFLIIGAAISTVGIGIIYTLDLSSPSSQWIGYQILAGIGLGLCFQVPIMVGQALASPEDVSAITAILLCEFTPLRITQ